METAPQCEGKLWRPFRPFTRHCQHTFNHRVVCCYLISTQFGDAFARIWCTLCQAMCVSLVDQQKNSLSLSDSSRHFLWIDIFCWKFHAVIPVLPLCPEQKIYRSGRGTENRWPSLQNMNLSGITLEYSSDSYSLNHGLCPVLFILFKPHSLLG